MNINEKKEILEKAKSLFKNTIVPNHIKNLEKLKNFSEFNTNPFLLKYLARFLTGNTDFDSQAKALIYPRVLGTSITTSFGMFAQKFCSTVLSGFGSTTQGIDIEYIDQLDKRKKYCQVKSGPETINNDDIETIEGKFRGVVHLARTNNLQVSISDLVVGVLYGTNEQLGQFYKIISETYPVYSGKEFWYRLTGDEEFYSDLIDTFADSIQEVDSKDLIKKVAEELATDLKRLSDLQEI